MKRKQILSGEVFGIGIIALKNRPIKVYKNLEDARAAALQCGCNFVAKHVIIDEDDEKKDERSVFAWDFNIKKRNALMGEYLKKGWGEKLSVLRSCEKQNWIEFTTSTGYNYIFPFDGSISNEVFETLKKLDSAWFTITEINGKNYVKPL